MITNPSSTPIAPEGMGPRSAFLLIVLLLGLGAFYWLSHDPNALDAWSDLKRTFDAPAPAAQPGAPDAVPAAPNTEAGTVSPPEKLEEERLQSIFDAQIAKLEKEMAETKGQPGANSKDGSPLVFIADPDCWPIGRQWRVSGHVSNSSDKAARSRKVTITLLIDGEPAEEQTVEVGPFEPQGIQSYEALFRPSRDTRNHTVTASASWR